tara:strand:+ start:314 stop:1567 length:1254 start_codon:yes stop_codon:yes gene_type:complete
MKKKVIIIGGGIIGLSSAYFLHLEGHEVVVIEKKDLTEGASFENAGYLIPSHIVPLASPGMISKGIKWMFNSSSPFYIKPRLNRDLFSWGMKFVKSCNNRHVEKSISIIKGINELSKSLYQEMHRSNIFDFHLVNDGLLMAFKTSKAEKEELKTMKIAQDLGLDVSLISPLKVQELQPNIKMNIQGAFHYRCDSHSTPSLFMKGLERYLISNGVKILKNSTVQSFNLKNKTIKSIETNTGIFDGDYFILSAGAWSENLIKPLGIFLPVQAGKGYCINASKDLRITIPAILIESKVAVTPMKEFTRFSGTMEICGINHNINKKRVEAISRAASKYYENFSISIKNKKEAKSALRPLSPDGLPFIGRHSAYSNLVFATGHSMMGWSLGPATGKLVSEIISNKKLSLSIDAFNPERTYGV